MDSVVYGDAALPSVELMQRRFLMTSILSPGARPFVPLRDRIRRPVVTYLLWRRSRLVSPLTGRVNVGTIRQRLIDDHWSFSRVTVDDVRAKGVQARAADDGPRIALSLTTTECNHWCSGIGPATCAALLSISLGSFHISMDHVGQSVSRQVGDSQF